MGLPTHRSACALALAGTVHLLLAAPARARTESTEPILDQVNTLLEAIVSWSPDPRLMISAGRFKTPFSREFIQDIANIDFVNRSRVVVALVPNRQRGLRLRGMPEAASPGRWPASAVRLSWVATSLCSAWPTVPYATGSL
jgi:hypothetical protein